VYIPPTLPATLVNIPYLVPFYGVSHAPFALASLWNIHDCITYL
jgi:hypothetical protein